MKDVSICSKATKVHPDDQLYMAKVYAKHTGLNKYKMCVMLYRLLFTDNVMHYYSNKSKPCTSHVAQENIVTETFLIHLPFGNKYPT